MRVVGRLANAAKLNVTGLVLAAAGMMLQIMGGSELYPSFVGPIVLLVAAVIVTFRRSPWASWVGLLVPLVLGLGAIVAAFMSGAFIAQLADVGKAGIFLGSLMHMAGLAAAVVGGIEMVRRPRGVPDER